jgi:hypothetical protein
VRQRRNEEIEQKYRKWCEQIERESQRRRNQPKSQRQQWIEQVQREQVEWLKQIEQEGQRWAGHVDREVQQWNERIVHLKQQWYEQHRRLIQRWDERAEQLVLQWSNRDAAVDPRWYEQINRECREWREQPAREWREWAGQLSREAQQMREQVERDRRQVQERTQQGRQKQAETYLAGRAAELLDQTYARAQHCVASLFPLPNLSRPARTGNSQAPATGSSRPRSDSPPPLDNDFHKIERIVHVDGHRNLFRTRIRRLLRDTLGFSQRQAQEWAEAADSCVDYAVMKGVKFLIGRGVQTISTGAGVIAGSGMVAAGVCIGAVEHERIIRGQVLNFPTILSNTILRKLMSRSRQ